MFLGKTNLKFDFLQIIFHECCILHPSSYNMIIQLFYLKFTYFNVNGFGKSYKELFLLQVFNKFILGRGVPLVLLKIALCLLFL